MLAMLNGDGKLPLRWIYLESEGESEAIAPKVAIRSDNAYIVGFTNNQGGWFQFENMAVLIPKATNQGYVNNFQNAT